MSRRTFPALVGALLTIPLLLPAGCKKDDTVKKSDVLAKLAKLDAVDGTADKVVSKCGGCELRMDGSGEHAINVSGYEMHFCSAKCKKDFYKDTTRSILALTIPKK